MIDFNVSVSAPDHECQIVTELPAGGGDKGGLGGSSVAVTCGVLMINVGARGEGVATVRVLTGVTDLVGVCVGLGVDVAGPGYGSGVFVISGPG
jgi:hypothetical protein